MAGSLGVALGVALVALVALVSAILGLLALTAPPASAADGTGFLFTYAGGDRVATAIAVSQGAYPNGAERVYLARADAFPDALAGASLGGGPLLLVPPTGPVPGVLISEVTRLSPSLVVAFGGRGALSDATVALVAGDRDVQRLGGETRFDTAVEISRFGFVGGADEVYLARADDFADALSAGSLQDGPVLLVPRDGIVPPQVVAEVARLDPRRVIALGGPAAVSPGVLAQAAVGHPTGRLAGVDRYDTSVAIAGHAWGTATGLIPAVVSGVNFPDGLAAGGIDKGPVLLVPPCGDLPVSVDIALQAGAPRSLALIGGPSAICPDLANRIATAANVIAGGTDLDTLDDADQDQTTAHTWEHAIRYAFGDGTRDLADWQAPIRRAMDTWEALGDVQFVPAAAGEPVDLTISFEQGCHFPNIWGHPCFDGAGAVLAHASIGDGSPAHNYLHFDDAQHWVDSTTALPPLFDLQTVAVHELGHVLGIQHLDDPEAVMYASYFGPIHQLTTTDLLAYHQLYP